MEQRIWTPPAPNSVIQPKSQSTAQTLPVDLFYSFRGAMFVTRYFKDGSPMLPARTNTKVGPVQAMNFTEAEALLGVEVEQRVSSTTRRKIEMEGYISATNKSGQRVSDSAWTYKGEDKYTVKNDGGKDDRNLHVRVHRPKRRMWAGLEGNW